MKENFELKANLEAYYPFLAGKIHMIEIDLNTRSCTITCVTPQAAKELEAQLTPDFEVEKGGQGIFRELIGETFEEFYQKFSCNPSFNRK